MISKDDMNAQKSLKELGTGLKLMDDKTLRIITEPDLVSGSLDTLRSGNRASIAPLLAINALSTRDANGYQVTITTPQELVNTAKSYDPDVDAVDVEKSIETGINQGLLILSRVLDTSLKVKSDASKLNKHTLE